MKCHRSTGDWDYTTGNSKLFQQGKERRARKSRYNSPSDSWPPLDIFLKKELFFLLHKKQIIIYVMFINPYPIASLAILSTHFLKLEKKKSQDLQSLSELKGSALIHWGEMALWLGRLLISVFSWKRNGWQLYIPKTSVSLKNIS